MWGTLGEDMLAGVKTCGHSVAGALADGGVNSKAVMAEPEGIAGWEVVASEAACAD